MFVGHYAPAAALAPIARKIPLWHLFVAVQLIDYAWAIFILTGVELARVTPGFLAASHLDLFYMPFTHSLAAVVAWMTGAGIIYRMLINRQAGWAGALVIATAVGSHWILDLLVHAPDLALYPGSDVYLGYGLWRSLVLSQIVEFSLLGAGLLIYMRSTAPAGLAGRVSPWVVLSILGVIQTFTLFAPPLKSIQAYAALALGAYTVFAALVVRFRHLPPLTARA